MPIYEFQCKDCGKVSEFLVIHARDQHSHKCQFCGSNRLKKILSAPGVVKGEGASAAASGKDSECCGMTNPCNDPKRCCTE